MSEQDWTDPKVSGLVARLAGIERAIARRRRHEELMEVAVERGRVSREVAELAYEIALEEKLDPAYGVELVASGIGVAVADPEADVPMAQSGRPDFVEVAPPRREARRERVMRETFRRLRTMLDREEQPMAAFRSLVREPDIGEFEYR